METIDANKWETQRNSLKESAWINENVRFEKERERQAEENRDKGEWHYDGESAEYYWTGETEPEYDQIHDSPSILTKEELDIVRQAEEREILELMEQRKKDLKEKRQKKNEERRVAMDTPVKIWKNKRGYHKRKIRGHGKV